MDQDEVLELLRKEGLAVRDSTFHAEAFGSWWIELATEPSLRLVWDGKEGWAIVQTFSEVPSRKNRWDDRWIGRDRHQAPAEIVRRALEQLQGGHPTSGDR